MVQHNEKSETGWNGSAPWWMKAIYQVGVPSAIAIYLVYNLVSNMPLKAEVPSKADMATISESLRIHVTSTSTDLQEVKRILLATCLNQATKDVQRLQCLGKTQ